MRFIFSIDNASRELFRSGQLHEKKKALSHQKKLSRTRKYPENIQVDHTMELTITASMQTKNLLKINL